MEKSIYPCIWCDNNMREMADFYLSIFPDTEIVDQNAIKWRRYVPSQSIMFTDVFNTIRNGGRVNI